MTSGAGPARPAAAGGTSGSHRITATVNGEPYEAAAGTTVADLVTEWCPSPRGVAVAIDGDVVPRSTWAATPLAPGAEVEIVTAAAGG